MDDPIGPSEFGESEGSGAAVATAPIPRRSRLHANYQALRPTRLVPDFDGQIRMVWTAEAQRSMRHSPAGKPNYVRRKGART
jgi:hypothetical protein